MKTHSRLCRVTLLFLSHSILLLTSTAIVAAQKPGCDATVKAKLYFKELRTQFIKDRSSVDKSEFRRAARNYIRLAEQCYESTVGESAIGQRVDEGGMWMGPSGATTTAPPVSEEFVLFGTKWGAGSPFAGGTDVPGPRLPGGTVTYSFMADGVNLTMDAPGLFNVAISSMGSFAPCFLDEIELAFGAWSAVADILFVPVPDGGGLFNVDPMADIRIGAHVFDGPSGTLAHGFFPPPNGVTAAGDVHFDSAEPWTCAPGAGSIGFGLVAVHELGHAIGLDHELTEIAVMNPFYNAALTFGPLADDLIGAGEIYGEAGAAGTSFFGPVGIGTTSPSEALHVKGSDGTARLLVEETNGTPAAREMFRMVNNGGSYFSLENTDTGGTWFFVHENRSPNRFIITPSGSPGPKFVLTNSGDLTVPGTITSGGPICGGGCDEVFDPDYEIESIEEHAASMWENSHLPGVGPTNSRQPTNLTEKVGGLINELEKAHIYVERLHERLREEKSRNDELEKRLARVESLLGVDRAAD